MTDQPAQPPHRRKSRFRRLPRRTRRLMVAATLIWLGILLTVSGQQAVNEFSRPLGEPLPAFAQTPRSLTPGAETGPGFSPATPDPRNAPSASPRCGGPPQMILLLAGTDTGTTTYVRGLADTIRVVRFDFVTPAVSVLSVPRALWVYVPSLAEYENRLLAYFGRAQDMEQEGPYAMLNSSYFYGNLYELPGRGPGVLAEALYVNLGLPVDHYAVVNMQVVVDMVDAIGGLDITVPDNVAEFAPGPQHMTGQQVLTFARTRQSDSDWHRIERQNIVLFAAWEAMTQPRNLVKIPLLIDRFADQVQTDLSRAQIASIACLMTGINPGDVRRYSISPEMVTVSSTTGGFYILLPQQDKIAPEIAAFLSGN